MCDNDIHIYIERTITNTSTGSVHYLLYRPEVYNFEDMAAPISILKQEIQNLYPPQTL